MSYDFFQHASVLGLSKKFESAKLEAIVSGRSVAMVSHRIANEWEIVVGPTVLIPDLIVRPDGKPVAMTSIGRKALAQVAA